jgi:hypothetical protein
MTLEDYLKSLQNNTIDGYTSIVRITNTSTLSVPLSIEPWADFVELHPNQWVSVLIVGAKHVALDVHIKESEIIAYAELGTIIQIFDQNGMNIYGNLGWKRKPFPSPDSLNRTK